jgi:hypothetical protein
MRKPLRLLGSALLLSLHVGSVSAATADHFTCEFGGGELGAGFTQISIDSLGALRYKRLAPYVGTWPQAETAASVALPPTEAAKLFERLAAAHLPDIKSVKIPCCDYETAHLTGSFSGKAFDILVPGWPCKLAKEPLWSTVWEQVCSLLKQAEPAYWQELGCPCPRS